MPTANDIDPTVEVDSISSSGGSFVQSMNKLSTAKGSSSPSEMSGGKTSEVSEDSDPESTKSDETDPKSDSKDSPKEQESTSGAPAVCSNEKRDDIAPNNAAAPKGDEAVPHIASGLDSNGSDCKSVEALALIAVEAGARHASFDETGSLPTSIDANVASLQHRSADIAPPATAIYSRPLGGSDQSVDHTVASSISGNSVQSGNNVSAIPSNAAALKGTVEQQAPMGLIHMKGKKPSSKAATLPKFQSATAHAPAPIAPMPVVSTTRPSTKPKSSSLRRGKWTAEEEAYVARVIQDFNSGFLNAPAGTTLRSYLSEKLHCDPMRITKKFTGDACIGKRVFHPVVRCASNTAAIDKAQTELDALERRWRRRLEMQQRESAKKAAASAAAAVAAATGRSHMQQGPIQAAPAAAVAAAPVMSNPHLQAVPQPPPSSHHVNQTAIARTATWLDRANAILATRNDGTQAMPMHPIPTTVPIAPNQPGGAGVLPPQELENQMKEVQRLIHEGPIIQQTTAGLPHMLEQPQASTIGQRKVTDDAAVDQEPADKRARTSASQNSSGAEDADAKALVGFLNSVRASAEASGNDFTSL